MADGFFLDELRFEPILESVSDDEPELMLIMVATNISLGSALGEWLGDFIDGLPRPAQDVFDENYEQHAEEFVITVSNTIQDFAEGLKTKLLVEAQRRDALGS